MSYENTTCPCGSRKERETMICAACRDYTASTIEAAVMNDTGRAWQSRRNAAIKLLAICRTRHQKLALTFKL
jgi:hypothetical protein